MCIIDGNVDCIIEPISNAIYNIIYPFFAWLISSIYGVFNFIYNIGILFSTIYNMVVGLFWDIYATNSYAATCFSIILMAMTLIFFIRIYNILSGIEIFGFKLPKL